MVQSTRLVENRLLVVDESPSCLKPVEYIGKMLGCRRGFRVRLLYLLLPLPPELLEFGGSENPRKERRLEKLRRDQREWIASAHESACRCSATPQKPRTQQVFLIEISLTNSLTQPNIETRAAQFLKRRKRTTAIHSHSHMKHIPSFWDSLVRIWQSTAFALRMEPRFG